MGPLFIGLMSGTSLDGVDGVLVEFPAESDRALQIRGHVWQAFAPDLRDELRALNTSGPDELHRAALAGNALARLYAEVASMVLIETGVSARDVRAIGAHGQTVRHCPKAFDGTGYTLQIVQPALLAELTDIDVVADFRARDVAAGGQGAPLVPAFHKALFAQTGRNVAVLNLGGIANLSLLPSSGPVTGFDCGPANVLLDHWHQRHRGQPFDRDGEWAAGGSVLPELLGALLAEPYFSRLPPKSTGRDLFDAAWLERKLAPHANADPRDVQATLAELTATSIASDLLRYAPATEALWVCGGGAHNGDLCHRLRARLPRVHMRSTQECGLSPTQIEAAAFAWLARAFVAGAAGNIESVTGARGPRRLGAWYPAR
jgi:anhydro-N-acetylmuramic acid kinase